MDSNSIANARAKNNAFFATKIIGRKTVCDGIPECLLGHKIPRTNPTSADGIYAEWNWDGKRLLLKNDRYGIYPIFYSCTDTEICVSPSIFNILSRHPSVYLDYAALSVFFRLGHFIFNDTPFKNIFLLPPNTKLLWQDGKLEVHKNELYPSSLKNKNISYNEAVETYAHKFQQAIQRRHVYHHDFAVPISGGRDSRHIIFELNKQGKRPKFCLTVRDKPPATNEDMRIARLIAKELHIHHIEVDKPSSWFRAVLDDVYLTNYCGGGHSWILPVAERLIHEQVPAIYDGLGGDVLSNGHFLDRRKVSLYEKGKLQDLAALLLGGTANEHFIKRCLTGWFYKQIPKELAIERLIEELKRHESALNPVLNFNFWNRTRRAISSIPFAILADIPIVYCPYLDHDLFDFLTGLDSSFFLAHNFHDDTIRFQYPEYANIPYENKDVAAAYDAQDYAYYKSSIKELWSYLAQRGLKRSLIIKNRYIYTKAIIDLIGPRCENPWYLRSIVYGLELEKLLSRDVN